MQGGAWKRHHVHLLLPGRLNLTSTPDCREPEHVVLLRAQVEHLSLEMSLGGFPLPLG